MLEHPSLATGTKGISKEEEKLILKDMEEDYKEMEKRGELKWEL